MTVKLSGGALQAADAGAMPAKSSLDAGHAQSVARATLAAAAAARIVAAAAGVVAVVAAGAVATTAAGVVATVTILTFAMVIISCIRPKALRLRLVKGHAFRAGVGRGGRVSRLLNWFGHATGLGGQRIKRRDGQERQGQSFDLITIHSFTPNMMKTILRFDLGNTRKIIWPFHDL